MRQTISLLLAALLLIATANRSPAPVTEDTTPTPAPKPKQESTPRPKPKTQSAPKPKAPAGASFAGTWAGNTVNNASDGSSGSASYVIKISNDEKAVLITMGEAGKTVSGPPTPTTCTRFGDALTWSFSASDGTTTYTMKLNSNGMASFLREGRYIGGDLDGITYSHAGTFTKNGAAAPIDSATAASTEVVAQPTPKTGKGGLPVAAPVPNKPGYVYNPFDPNSKILLNVNGKASGSKVKDPFSGKLFIVP